MGHQEPTTEQWDQAYAYASAALDADDELRHSWGWDEQYQDATYDYAHHNLSIAYAFWLKAEIDHVKYPFCLQCGEGHNPQKISCEDVQLMLEADAQMGDPNP